MNDPDLQARFAQQRQRRTQMMTRLPQATLQKPRHHTGTYLLFGVLLVLLLAFVAGAVLWKTSRENLLNDHSQTLMIQPATYLPYQTDIPPATVPNEYVCTGVSNGKLHVRFAPGDGSAVRGYLHEGELVETDNQATVHQGSRWIHTTTPIEGWVNNNYICKENHP